MAVIESSSCLVIGHSLTQAGVHVDCQPLHRVVTDIVEGGITHLHVAHGQGAGDLFRVAWRRHQTGDRLQSDLATFHDSGSDGRD